MYGHNSIAIPRPKLGDIFVRDVERGGLMREEAMITNILGEGDTWRSYLPSTSGADIITGAREVRGDRDWRPAGWVKDPQRGCYHPKDMSWSEEEGAWVTVGEKVLSAPAAGGNITTSYEASPEPEKGERFLSWRARAAKALEMGVADEADLQFFQAAWNWWKEQRAAG